jgi:hypothetical protein
MDQQDPIRYDQWLEEALRGVVRRALEHTRDNGLVGEHHYYITFDTDADGVQMPDHLRALHPNDMTIVLQNQFEYLDVDDDGFGVTLRFSGRPARLVVPFSALTAFADPSVNFGLQLSMTAGLDDDELEEELEAFAEDGGDLDEARFEDEMAEAEATGTEPGSAEVITLDAFRKK